MTIYSAKHNGLTLIIFGLTEDWQIGRIRTYISELLDPQSPRHQTPVCVHHQHSELKIETIKKYFTPKVLSKSSNFCTFIHIENIPVLSSPLLSITKSGISTDFQSLRSCLCSPCDFLFSLSLVWPSQWAGARILSNTALLAILTLHISI